MVTVTIDIPKEINKEIEHFKIDKNLKDKRDAIVLLLKKCLLREEGKKMEDIFKEVDKMPPVKVSVKQLRKMKEEMYTG